MKALVNFIGAGNLGKTIAYLFLKKQVAEIGAICNTTKSSTLAAIAFIGGGTYCPSIKELPPADITFITTPDREIHQTSEALSHALHLQKNSIVVHCSGALHAGELAPVGLKNCKTMSIHPMGSFANPVWSIEHFAGTHCAMEGHTEALSLVGSLFNTIGAITYPIDTNQKSLYHVAGIFSSNYVVTLAAQALSCLKAAGLAEDTAMAVMSKLMQGTVSNISNAPSLSAALTGPIQRAEAPTLVKHLEALSDNAQKKLYTALGIATIPLANLEANQKTLIEQVFSDRTA